METVWTLLIGFLIGVLAKFLTMGREPSGFIIPAVIGMAGSLGGTIGAQALGLYRADDAAGFFGSFIGAIVLLAVYHFIRRRRPG